MRIYREISFNDFEPWSGAVSMYNRIINNELEEEFENTIEELYPEGLSETELNDILWFESDEVCSWLGLATEEELEDEISELESEIDDLTSEYEESLEEAECEEEREILTTDYESELSALQIQIDELKEQLKTI